MRRQPGQGGRLGRIAVLLMLALLAGTAAAQRCTYEVEPNDTPALATRLSGEGADAVAAARSGSLGSACLAGELTSGDQDAFLWVVDEAAAAHVWQVEIEGARGGLTQLDLIDVEFAENGEDVVRADSLFRFGTSDGSPAVSGDFLVQPGRYVLGLSQAGAAGEYVVNLRPRALSREAAELRAGRALEGAFDVYAPLQGGFVVPFTVPQDRAGFVWGVTFQAPVGTRPTLTIEGPAGVVGTLSGAATPARLTNMGLPPGEYRASVVPGSPEETGYASVGLQAMGRATEGVEVEPNDRWEDASWLALGAEVSGIAERTDYFVIEVPADLDGSAWDLNLEAESELRLRLYGPGRELLQERRGVSGTTRGLHLATGSYWLTVEGQDDVAYTLSLSPTQVGEEGYEREPNDLVSGASAMGPDDQVRGELWAQDQDFFRLEVSGEAQRYRLQVVGQGVAELALYDASGSRLAAARGDRRIRLDEVVLLPGTNFIRVTGTQGQYALRALSLGPAPASTPPADAPAKDEALEPVTPRGADEQNAEVAVADPNLAALPPLPPPPPGLLEVEPNGDSTRALRIEPGVVHVGRLSAVDDEDHFRFHLAADQYVRVELLPASGETGWRFRIDNRDFHVLASSANGAVVAETWLLAGDHSVQLYGGWIDEAPSDYYQLRLTPLGSLGLPIDREPNDTAELAALMPAELAWSGRVGESGDSDVYRLPVFDEETIIELTASADEGVRFDLLQTANSRFEVADDATLRQTLPVGEQAYLRVGGRGAYALELAFSTAPSPSALLAPRAGGELEVGLEFETTEAAAFWHQGQALSGTLNLTNRGATDLTASLAASTDNARVVIELPGDATVRAGETVSLPVDVRLPSDVSDQAPVALQIAASGGASLAVTGIDLALRCEAPPVGAFGYWSVPDELLGKPNVLLAGLGAVVPAGLEAASRDRYANDGRTTVSNGGWVGADHAATFQLAGDGPVMLLGTILNPASDAAVERQLKRFRIETSLDGVLYEPVLEGQLAAAKVDQAFVFEQPVQARYARLVGLESHRGAVEGYFGEWKLIADEPTLLAGVDLAEPKVGGHVVWSKPLLNIGDSRDLLTGEGSIGSLDMRAAESLSLALGFENGRAALVSRLSLTQPEVDAKELFAVVEVAVSQAGAAGPWQPLLEAELGAAGQVTDIELESPVWARYLRLTFPTPEREGGRFYRSPRALTVLEAPSGSDYRSVLAEWGTDTTNGPYEYFIARPDGQQALDPDAGDTAAEATQLDASGPVSGTVAVAEDVDWYRLSVPTGDNHLAVRLSGDPAIAYRYELTTADGSPVAVQVREEGHDVLLTAFVEPGDYLLRLEEPERTVIFAWDTSGSVSPYQAITYSSLASFARGVEEEREAVQLLAFDHPVPQWLLPYWSSDAQRVQRAITDWDRNADSSNAELALLTATDALRGREGTKAVLFMTDAETDGNDLTADLWSALEDVGPRVFTFEISSGGNEYPQQLMQSWAGVNAGVYQMARGVGDFDAGFARASCLLRRPKRYTVEVATAAVEPPGPGTLTVSPSPDAGQAGVHVIFDASGSMGQLLPSGEQRIVAAKRALEGLVGGALEEGTPFSLRAFGHVAPNSCETSLDVARGPLDRPAALAAVGAIEPKLLSQTAIADSLRLAIDDLAGATGPRTVILITDGQESCGGDPAAAAAELRAAGDTTIAIVSLALDPGGLAVFEALSDEIGATYVDVGSFEGLQEAIAAALKPAFEVYDVAGELVAAGRVGESVELPMGVYQVRVLTTPAEVFENVTVPGDGSVVVTASGRP